MWIKASGPLTENVFHMSTNVSTHLLVVSEAAAVIDTSISAVHERFDEEIKRFLGEDDEIDFILITHAHFDHVGGIPFLRRRYPEALVIAAPQTAELLEDEAVVSEFYKKNLACAEALKVELDIDEEQWKAALKVDRIIGDVDSVDLGDEVEIKLVSSPGHTSDSVAYYVRPDSVLACGESLGSYNGRDKVAACFCADYTDYLESLERLSGLDVAALCLPHSGLVTGELVPRFFMEARQKAEQFCELVKERVEQGELIEEIYQSLLPEWQAEDICPEGPFVEEQLWTLEAMVKAAAAVVSSKA